jgi:hypothetical protein
LYYLTLEHLYNSHPPPILAEEYLSVSFEYGYSIFPEPFVAETIHSPLNGLGTLVDNQLAYM